MPSPPRILFHKTVIMVTTRIEEGLPLVPTAFMNLILMGILARAQALYPVEIVAFKFMGNHLHMILVVHNPDDVVGFMDRIKTESSHAINRLLGRRRRTVWQKGYDSVAILTPSDVVKKLVYVYTNAQAADLVERIEDYPGTNSWQMFVMGQTEQVCKRIRRTMIAPLPSTKLSVFQQEKLAKEIAAAAQDEETLTIDPDAWLRVFGITGEDERLNYRRQVIDSVREEESKLNEKRAKAGKSVLGRDRLRAQRMNMAFTPKKYSKRMWCVCRVPEIKARFIALIKWLVQRGREVRKRWLTGEFSVPYPPGLFPPRAPKLCNLRYA